MPQPDLPSELLSDIFHYLIPTDTTIFNYDLLSASLVSPSWHRVARPLFANTHLRSLFQDRYYTHAELARTRVLLDESHCLGADDARLIERLRIRTSDDWFGFPPIPQESADHIYAILALARNLTDLHLNLNVPRGGHDALKTLYASLKPAHPTIRRLAVFHSIFSPAHDGIIDLIAHLPKLDGIELYRLDLLPELVSVLASREKMKHAVIRRPRVREFHLCIARWSNLRSLHISGPMDGCERVWEEVARSCPLLESFYYKRDKLFGVEGPGAREENAALSQIVTQCQKIESLYLDGIAGIGGEFLVATMREGRTLKNLSIIECENVVMEEGGEWENVEKPWPMLEHLTLSSCGIFDDAFVERVLERCERLHTVIFKGYTKEGLRWPTLFKTHGFEIDAKNVWRRELGYRKPFSQTPV
ncbi:hypothetical protein BC938DRAFT_474947 [Jimgerdemannia flammicorona]|uniref:F-box domain-containing protein n=1 Tax=Jimgerdemannia flammicorona TaxID=994334 RepID=A0A433Q1C4_9FUNG|nr:hypothetical protein BC938DRAFT_474947 [Jimgerdemannia flammicorona]